METNVQLNSSISTNEPINYKRDIPIVLLILAYYFSLMYIFKPSTVPWLILISLPGMALLATKRFELLVFLLFSSTGFVVRDPAPFEVNFILTFLGTLWFFKLKDILSVFKTHKIVHWCLGLFLLGNAISLVNAINLTRGIVYFGTTVFMVGLFYLVWVLGRDEKYLKNIVRGYILGAIVVSIISLIFFFIDSDFSTLFYSKNTPRLLSTFKDPNVYASFLFPIIIILVKDIKESYFAKINRPLLIVISSIISLALILSFSRASWGTLTLCLILFLLLLFKNLEQKTILSYIAVVFLTITSFSLILILNINDSYNFLNTRMVKDGTFTGTSDLSRLASQKQAIIAVGLGSDDLISEEERIALENKQKPYKILQRMDRLNHSENLIDQTDKSIKYTGQWETVSSSSNIGKSLTKTQNKGSSAELQFKGTSIMLYAVTSESFGIAKITIDNKVEFVDLYSPKSQHAKLVYQKTGLPIDNHTIKIEFTGKKNPSSKGSAITIDAFEVMKQTKAIVKTTNIEQTTWFENSTLITILGIGAGQYEEKYYFSTHNSYLRVLAENGLVSTLTLCFFVIYLTFVLIRGTLFSLTKISLSPFLVIVLGFLINGLVIDTIHWRHLWIFFALSVVIIDQTKSSGKFAESRK